MADGDISLKFKLLGEDATASRAFNKVGQSSDHLSAKMVAVGTAVGHLAASGILALGGMAAGAVKTGIQTAAAMQQAQLGFATLLGSEQAAGDYMKWLTGFAAATPFELKGLVESSRTLIGVGVSAGDAKTMLQNFGDTASAIGIDQDAFQRVMLATSQAISAGKFQAGDLNQIMTNGIPVWTILSKAMHKSVPELRDLASHGKLLSKDVLPALQAEMHKDYGGAMAKQSQTLNGLWSTFQDTLHLGMANVLQPLIPILQKILPGAMDTLGKWFGTTAQAAKGFIDGVSGGNGKGLDGTVKTFHDLGVKAKDAFDKIKAAIVDAKPTVEGFFTFVQDHGTAFQSFAVAVLAAATAYRIWTAVTAALTVAQTALDVALDANPIGLIVIAIAGLVAGLVYAYTHSETFRNVVNGAFGAVKDFVVAAVDKIKEAWSAFTSALSTAKDKAVAAFGAVVEFVRGVPGKIEGFLSSLPGKVGEILKSAAEKGAYYFGYGLGTIVKLAMELPGKVVGFLASLPDKVASIIVTLATKGAAAFASFVTTVASKAASLAAQIPPFVASLVSRAVALLAALPGKAVAALKALPGLIKGAFAAAGTWLLDAGKQIVQGLVNGIKNAAGNAVAAVKDIGGNILSGFKDAMGISSPAKKMIPLGVEVVRGVEEGLKSRAPAVYNLLEQFAQRISNIKVTAGVKSALGKLATDAAADMRAATGKLDQLKNAIDDQRKKVADLVKAKADYAATLTSGLTGGGTIAGIQLAEDATDAEGNVTPADKVGSFIAALRAKGDAITKFGTDIAALRAKGLSQSILQQIEQSGLETGGALAAALATASPKAIQQIDVLSKTVQDRSDLFGKRWASNMYDSGIKAAEGIVRGLQSKEAEILATIRRLAQSIVNEIKSTLKIKSPSAVMRDEVGAMIPAGLIAGINGGAPGVAAAVNSLVGTPGTVAARVGLGVGGAVGTAGVGGGDTHVHVHVAAGFIGSPDQLATALSDVVQRAKSRGTALAFG